MSVRPFIRTEPTFWVNIEADSGEARLAVVDPAGVGTPAPDNAVRVLSFAYTDSERKADTLRITVDNFNLQNFDDPVWKKGNHITASWGYPGRMALPRRLVITKVSGFTQLTIEAKAESVIMNRVVRNRRFENLRRSDVVRQIASENGFEDVDIEDTEVVLESIQQARLTDAQFLRRLANEEHFEFFVDYDGLHFHRRRTDERPLRRFRYYTEPNQGEVLGVNVQNDVTAKPARVRTRGRNPTAGEDVEGDSGEGGASGGGETTLAPVFELIDPETREGRRNPDYGRAPTASEENVAQEETRPTSTSSPDVARRQARGRARRHRQTAVKLSLEVIGDPQFYAKTVFQLEGVGRRLSIRYYVKEVVHNLDASGYKMKIDAVSDGHGGHSTASRAARGVELLDPGPANRGRRNRQEAPGGEGAGDGGSEPDRRDGEGDAREAPVFERVDPETRRTVVTYGRPDGRARRDSRDSVRGAGASGSGGRRPSDG